MAEPAGIKEVNDAITSMLLETFGDRLTWPTTSAALNLSIFDMKRACQDALPAATPPTQDGALIKNGDNVLVVDAGDDEIVGSPALATVSGVVLINVKLTA